MRHRQGLALVALSALMTTGPALAFSVGDAALQSRLGQPLRASIPLSFDSAEELEALDTLRAQLRAPASADEALPPGFFELSVVSDEAGRKLLLRSRQPLLEPVSTVSLKVSLRGVSIVRDIVLLPDPVGAEEPRSRPEPPPRLAAAVPATPAPVPQQAAAVEAPAEPAAAPPPASSRASCTRSTRWR